jgi:sugar phosphate isomerase/epimerase
MMTAALFSVSYAGYWGQHRLSLTEFLEKAAALGYPAVEFAAKRPNQSVLDYPDDESLEEVRRTAGRLGIEIATIAGYTDFTSNPRAAEVPFGEMQILYVRQLARMAGSLGAKIIRVFSGYFTAPENFASDWNGCVAALREAADAAAQYGVILGLQNHHDVGVSTESYEELLREVDHPNLWAMFDPWSVALIGDDLYQAARRMAPRMVQTTVADYIRLERFHYRADLVNYERWHPPAVRAVPLGEGFIDFEAFFAGLKEGGFDGYVAYEMCSPLRGGGSESNLDAASGKSLEKIAHLSSGP